MFAYYHSVTVNPSGTSSNCSCVQYAVITGRVKTTTFLLLYYIHFCLHTATVSALVSGILSVIVTFLITSGITWCVVMRGRQKRRDTSPDVQQGVHQQETPSNEFVEYEVPVLNQQREDVITTQDNVAYGGKISLQQNVAYEQVHVL